MKKTNIVGCVVAIILVILLAGIVYCCIKAGAESENEKGYLIRQIQEEHYVSRA